LRTIRESRSTSVSRPSGDIPEHWPRRAFLTPLPAYQACRSNRCYGHDFSVKSELVKLRVSAEQRDAWQQEANRSGLSLSAWLRRSADETVALSRALEHQVDDARRRRETLREAETPAVPPTPRRRQPHKRPRPRVTVGEALQRADANRGHGGPLL
jgi:hypothetical protein